MTGTVTGRSVGNAVLASAGSLALALAAAVLSGLAELPDRFALVSAGLALAWSLLSVSSRTTSARDDKSGTGPVGPATAAAVATGLAAALVLAVGVVARVGRAVLELVNGAPLLAPAAGGSLAEAGAWALLLAACLAQLARARDGAVISALFGLLVLGAMRLSLLMPVFQPMSSGGHARSAFSIVLLGSVAAVFWAFVIANRSVHTGQRARWFAGDLTRPPPGSPCWPGFQPVCGAVGLLLVLLVCYHLGSGFDVAGLGRRGAAMVVACISGASGIALLTLLRPGKGDDTAELGMGLISVAICCAAVMALPAAPAGLARRFPLILNATLIGLAVATWLWAWLGCVWRQQLDQGSAWTVTGGLIGPAGRVSLFAGLLGLAAAALMAIWPRLAVAPEMDHTLGRFAGGVAGHLLLLGAALWSSRRLGRSRFMALAILTVASMLGFVFVRWKPLTTAVF